MKGVEIRLPLVKYEKDELIDVSEAWTMDEERNKSVTSTVGYVPLEKRINALLQAGENLELMRNEFYGVEDDDDDYDDEMVSDYDSKIELTRSIKERSERLSKKFKNERKEEEKSDKVATEHSEVETATEDSSGVKDA